MKKYIVMIVIAAVLIMFTPKLLSNAFTDLSEPKTQQEFTLTLVETSQEITLSAEDYLAGCLFAQIDVSYHLEALKAQAAAAYTYALRLLQEGRELSNSTSYCQPYFTPADAKEYYGDSYEKYLPAVKEAAAYGAQHPIYYENKPIYSVYHSVSTGVTARPEYIWGLNLPYLASKSCPDDMKYKDLYTSKEMTVDDMRRLLLYYDPALQMPLDYSQWFTNIKRNENGYVQTIDIGGKTVSGGEAWRALELRSTSFDISWNGTFFAIANYGCGHGAGMSQYSANAMANRGQTAKEILEYFYDGCTVK